VLMEGEFKWVCWQEGCL